MTNPLKELESLDAYKEKVTKLINSYGGQSSRIRFTKGLVALAKEYGLFCHLDEKTQDSINELVDWNGTMKAFQKQKGLTPDNLEKLRRTMEGRIHQIGRSRREKCLLEIAEMAKNKDEVVTESTSIVIPQAIQEIDQAHLGLIKRFQNSISESFKAGDSEITCNLVSAYVDLLNSTPSRLLLNNVPIKLLQQ